MAVVITLIHTGVADVRQLMRYSVSRVRFGSLHFARFTLISMHRNVVVQRVRTLQLSAVSGVTGANTAGPGVTGRL